MPLPVTWWKRQKQTQTQARPLRTAYRLIEVVNELCIKIEEALDPSMRESLEDVMVQGVITVTLSTEELVLLREHINQYGWTDLSSDAQSLMRKVFEKHNNPS